MKYPRQNNNIPLLSFNGTSPPDIPKSQTYAKLRNPPCPTSTTPPETKTPQVYNKIDSISLEHLNALAREPSTCVMSCELDLGIPDVVARCWAELKLLRIYTKRKGIDPDFSEALIVRSGATIEDVCDQVHRTLKETFKYALVWGASARHVPQRVGLGHAVADEDVVSIVSAFRA